MRLLLLLFDVAVAVCCCCCCCCCCCRCCMSSCYVLVDVERLFTGGLSNQNRPWTQKFIYTPIFTHIRSWLLCALVNIKTTRCTGENGSGPPVCPVRLSCRWGWVRSPRADFRLSSTWAHPDTRVQSVGRPCKIRERRMMAECRIPCLAGRYLCYKMIKYSY